MLVIAVGFLLPQTVQAHASLIEASPELNAHFDQSPDQVVLTFNERLENELFYIKVFRQNGASVTDEAATMDRQQSEIQLQLPELKDGLYTVTYKVISADGHPVSESYVFAVGNADESAPFSGGLNHAHQHELSSDISFKQLLTLGFRAFYFLGLLLLAGWTLWGILFPVRSQAFLQWSLYLKSLFTVSVIAMVAGHLPDYVDRVAYADLAALFFGTSVGLSWMCSLLLALIGLAVLHRSRWFDGVWVLLLLLSKSISGHAMAFEPVIRTVTLDFIHLLAASLWAGGLLYIALLRRAHKEETDRFLPKFSNVAFASIVVLAVTGVCAAWIYLPKWQYVLYTQWGILLLVKCALVVLVIAAGAVLRYGLKRKGRPLGHLFKVDFSLMLLIVLIASVFTYLNPQPANQPLHWHVMGTTVHMTAEVTPNAPGNNTFTVTVWLPEGSGEPKAVQLNLTYQDDKDIAPIKVPLEAVAVDLPYGFLGFDQYQFQSEGPYLPFAGGWKAEVRVMDANDNETVYPVEWIVY